MAFQKTSHRAVLLEIAIVVVGILIAFALDSWWDHQHEAQVEASHLRALQGDFIQNQQRLQAGIANQERIATSSLTLLSLAQSRGPIASDSVRLLMEQVFSSQRFEPVMGAYQALVHSGGLAQLRHDSLRGALAEFASRLEGRYYERVSDDLYLTFIGEFAGRLGFRRAALITAGQDSSLALPDYHLLLVDTKFQEYLALRYFTERDVARTYRQLLSQARAIDRHLQAARRP